MVMTRLNTKTEEGVIEFAGHSHPIHKEKLPDLRHGIWSLMSDATKVAEAKTIGSVISTIEFSTPDGVLTAKATPFSRLYEFSKSDKMVGTITPAHLLTRKSIIDFKEPVPELIQIFCFWMAALKWYHAAQD